MGDFEDFLADCEAHHPACKTIHVQTSAMVTTGPDFQLYTQAEVIAFVANGLQQPCFQDSQIWHNNPQPERVIHVHNYEFYTGPIRGYLSFRKDSKFKWVIKSLKKNKLASEKSFNPLLSEQLVKFMSGGNK